MIPAKHFFGHWLKPATCGLSGARKHRRAPFLRRFEYLRCLGQGAQGVVHLCRELSSSESYVAVKLARPQTESRRCLNNEAEVLWALRGSHAVPQLRGLLYRDSRLSGFVTRYVAGQTLDRVLRKGRLSRKEVLSTAMATTEAVLSVLRRGYLHRDVKPENLLLRSDGRVELFDFGLACELSATPRDEVSGTLAYSSPEQLDAGTLSSKSDLFSLGLVLFEIATGSVFFSGPATSFRSFVTYRTLHLRHGVRSLPEAKVESGLAGLIRRLLVADPSRRADVAEVQTRVERLTRVLSAPACATAHRYCEQNAGENPRQRTSSGVGSRAHVRNGGGGCGPR